MISRSRHGRATGLACLALCSALAAFAALARAQEANPTTASTSMYLRTDTDHTQVYTPRLHVGAPVAEETRLDVVYTVDVWTSASIDIRTAASKRVIEQRDEIDASAQHRVEGTDLVLGGSYRHSTEHDYVSNGGSLGVSYDLADKAANLSLTLRAYFDRVGRAGDPEFDKASSTKNARLQFTQVIDADTFALGVYELTLADGFLSSPYRYVRFANNADEVPRTCAYPVGACLLENNPDSRVRHAIAGYVRRAFTSALSASASYRFYLDDWGVASHTIGIDASLVPTDAWLLSAGYRFYHQGKASFYEPFYLTAEIPAYYASDKELSTLSTHRIELEASRAFALDDTGTELRTVLIAAPSYFQYHDFPLLTSISAFELALSMEVRL